MSSSGETSCVTQALVKVLGLLTKTNLTTCRYEDVYDACWKLTAEGCVSDKTALVVMDGRWVPQGEHSGYASAISWILTYAMSEGTDSGVRYVIACADLPPHLHFLPELLRRAIAPHIVVGLSDKGGDGWVDVPNLLSRLQEPLQRDPSAQARLKSLLVREFLAPDNHHSISNRISPMLLAETLRSAEVEVQSDINERTATALRAQLRMLRLLDTEKRGSQEDLAQLKTVVESAQKRISAACGGPDNPHPIVFHLVDDNNAFEPVVDAVLGLKCTYKSSLPEHPSALSPGGDSILFLDMRLSSTEEGATITEASGYNYAFALARDYPAFPVVTFSSTQQRTLQDSVKKAGETDGVHNIITSFSKPSLAARGELNAKSCIESLKGLANAAVEAVMMIEQARAMRALIGGDETAAVKHHPFYVPLYHRRRLEALVLPADKPLSGLPPVAASTYEDMELISEFAMRWATRPQIVEALQVDTTTPLAGWVWALAVIRVWLAAGDPAGLSSFVGRLEAGLLPDYGTTGVAEGIPIGHSGIQRDTVHDVLLWATSENTVELSVAIKTIIQHVRKTQA